MNIGLNPGPRARTVKPGPRHLRTRPDPGQNRLGPHKGIPVHTSRYRGCDLSLSSHSPTANQGGAECHHCWSYKAIKFAFDAKSTNFDPDNNILSTQTFNEVCSISFNEDYIIEYINTLYEKRYINYVGVCPKTAQNKGYTIYKYVNWIGMHGKLAIKTTIVNTYIYLII